MSADPTARALLALLADYDREDRLSLRDVYGFIAAADEPWQAALTPWREAGYPGSEPTAAAHWHEPTGGAPESVLLDSVERILGIAIPSHAVMDLGEVIDAYVAARQEELRQRDDAAARDGQQEREQPGAERDKPELGELPGGEPVGESADDGDE